MIFFTSDQHFFHKNIINLSNRPFENVDDMNAGLISLFNKKVSPKDITYHLGDFAFADTDKIKDIISKLNGSHYFIKGNHDKFKNFSHDKIIGIGDYLELKIDKRFFVLSHYPMLSWNKSYHGSFMIHGHCHGNINNQNFNTNRIDVGVDSASKIINSYSPFSINEIINIKGENVKKESSKNGD